MAPGARRASGRSGASDCEESSASSLGEEGSTRAAQNLSDALRRAAHMRDDRRSWDNDFEKVFAAFRRGCISGTASGMLEDQIFDSEQMEVAWLFLLEVRQRYQIRRRQASECAKSMGASSRWLAVLQESPAVREALLDLPVEAQRELLEAAGAEALLSELESRLAPQASVCSPDPAAAPDGSSPWAFPACDDGAAAPWPPAVMRNAWPAAEPQAQSGAPPDVVQIQSFPGHHEYAGPRQQWGAAADPWAQTKERPPFGDRAPSRRPRRPARRMGSRRGSAKAAARQHRPSRQDFAQ